MLQSKKIITTQFMIDKNRNNNFTIEVDFIRQKIKCYTNIVIIKGKAQAQTTTLIKLLEDIAVPDNIIINAYYNRKKSKQNDIPLSQLIEERTQGYFYSILDKTIGDEVKTFEIKTDDSLGKDFQNVKNFIIKIENIAYRFLTQVMATI